MKTTRIAKLICSFTMALLSFVALGSLTGPFTESVDGITWTYSVKDGYAVLGYAPFVKRAVHPPTKGAVTIPASLGGYPVREIGEFAFHSCQSLTSVTIPEGVTTIAPRSFTWCGISTLTLPKSVSEVSGEAFATSGTSEKEYSISVTVADGNEHYKTVDGFLLTKDGTELVFSPMLKVRAAVPSTVKRIGKDAFCNHVRLEEVVLPASVETIGESAFLDCSGLKKIVFGGNAPQIGDYALRNTSATGYVGVGTTGWGSVPGTWNGVSLVYGKDNGGPYQETVDGIEWTYYVVKGGAEPRRGGSSRAAIATNTVGSVEIPGSLGGRPVTSVGNGAFYECYKVSNVIVPETVTNIASAAFNLCGIRTVKLPSYLASIGQSSFSWSEFRSLTIPEGVKEIPYYALSYCKSMTSVTLPSTLEKIGASAFIRDNSLTSLYLPAALKSIGDEGLSCCPKLKLTVDPENKTFKMIDGFLMSKDGTELVCCPGGIANGNIPAGTRIIRRNAFRECMKITRLVIPEGVTNIGYMAFCFMDNIRAIEFPLSYKNVANTMLFGGGHSGNTIREVAMPGEESIRSLFGWNSAVTNLVIIQGSKSIITNAFQGCTTIESVSLPDGLERIEDYAFAGCTALKSVRIPASVKYIGPHAFDVCSLLGTVSLPGEMPDGVAESCLLDNAAEVVCSRSDVKTVAELAPDGCDVYFWTADGGRMKIMGNPPPFVGGEGVVMEVVSAADSGVGSLREALSVALDGDVILFNLDRGYNEIVLTVPLVIKSNRFPVNGLTIGGDNGGRCVTIKGDGTFQLLTVNYGNKVNVDGITFKKGKNISGGAIGNSGALTVRNCGFMDNESPSWGGAICNMRAASCYAQNCDFIGNRCNAWGGAIASHTTPLTTILGCRFKDNGGEYMWGGAIAAFSTGDMLIIDCEIHDNQSYGGAVVTEDGARVTVIGSSITDNKATYGKGSDIFNLGGTVNAIGSLCKDNDGTVNGTTDLPTIPKKYSSLVSTETKALGSWYSKVVDASGRACMQLNAQACPRFAARTDGKPTFELTDEEYVTMKVENVKPLLYYGLGWADTLGGEFVVEPGMWLQADENGVLPGEVKAPKGAGSSRFFRVKVTDDPSVVK